MMSQARLAHLMIKGKTFCSFFSQHRNLTRHESSGRQWRPYCCLSTAFMVKISHYTCAGTFWECFTFSNKARGQSRDLIQCPPQICLLSAQKLYFLQFFYRISTCSARQWPLVPPLSTLLARLSINISSGPNLISLVYCGSQEWWPTCNEGKRPDVTTKCPPCDH